MSLNLPIEATAEDGVSAVVALAGKPTRTPITAPKISPRKSKIVRFNPAQKCGY